MELQTKSLISKFAVFLLNLPKVSPQVIQFANGTQVPVYFYKGSIACTTITIDTEHGPETYKFLEQNPNKPKSKWAEMARNGAKICWVIHIHPSYPNGERWIGRVENGRFIPNDPWR